jgi:hypothetical protein
MLKSRSDAFTRKYPRHRVLKEGKIISADLPSGIDVIIRDMSVGGARVEILPTLQAPDKFDLLVASEYLFYPAVVKWQRRGMLGIEFTGEPYRMRMVIDKP